jgi:MYXO-CTERM domain-containing protein
MAYNRSSDDSDSWWTVGGVALLLVGLLLGGILWQDGNQALSVFLILAGVVLGPLVIGVFSKE